MDVEQAIKENMGLVYKVLHKFNRAYDEDAISVAMEGLWMAAETFDKGKNFAFSTYATVCIYNAVGNYLRKLNRKRQLDVVSYDVIMNEDNGASFIEIMHGEASPEEELCRREHIGLLMRCFEEVFNELHSDTSKAVIECWRKSDYKATQSDIARELGISQAAVSRNLSAFRYKLKLRMEKYLC